LCPLQAPLDAKNFYNFWPIAGHFHERGEPEADARTVQVALENAQKMAADLNKKWYADCERA
jgi:hypothetical protein